MCDDRHVHVSFWTSSEEWHILSDAPEERESHVDIGWDGFPRRVVTQDFDMAIRAARDFLRTRSLTDGLSWIHESA
jgi:hypothetical protein